MNLQQHEQRIAALEAAQGKSEEAEVAFIHSTVSPFNARLATLESAVKQLQADVAALKG